MTTINRRNWLRKSALLGSGLAVAPGVIAKTMEQPRPATPGRIREILHAPFPMAKAPLLKAKLNANENPYGPSPKARLAILESVKMGNRYGHYQAADLMEMIAAKEGVSKDHIMLGPGSTDLLEKTAITHFIDGGNIVSADPAYMSLIKTAIAFKAEWKKVPLKPDWSHDLEGMAAAVDSKTSLVYVCNPNNPTGSITDSSKLRSFCSKVADKAPIFVDEAYLEFMTDSKDASMIDLVKKGKNVIISRTFSKIHGMAGLRIGYIVALPSTLKKITSLVRSNMGLCVTSLMGAMASLEDEAFLEQSRSMNAEVREFTFSELTKMGFDYVPSETSFVLFPIEMKGKPFLEKMYGMGVGVRAFEIDDKPYCRVSMGTMSEVKEFTQTIKKVLT